MLVALKESNHTPFRELVIPGCNTITTIGLRALSTFCGANLQVLDIRRCGALGMEDIINTLVECPNLHTFLFTCPITDSAAKDMAMYGKKLRHLLISSSYKFTNTGYSCTWLQRFEDAATLQLPPCNRQSDQHCCGTQCTPKNSAYAISLMIEFYAKSGSYFLFYHDG